MTLEKYKGRTSFNCDDCGARDEVAPEEGRTFEEAWNALKADGWRAKKNAHDGVFEHFCPGCVAAFRKGPRDEDGAAAARAYERSTGGAE